MKMYFTKHPSLDQYIVIKHGETGYYSIPDSLIQNDTDLQTLNDDQGVTPDQIKAALTCSMFDCWNNFDVLAGRTNSDSLGESITTLEVGHC